MRNALRIHAAVHLKFVARSRVFQGLLLVIVIGLAASIAPALFFFDRASRFVTLRLVAEQLHAAVSLIIACTALFMIWSHRRAGSIRAIAVTPSPFDAWVASIFAITVIAAVALQAVVALIVVGLSSYWNVPYQAGFAYLAIDRLAASLAMLAFVTALGTWVHPLAAVSFLILFEQSTFSTILGALESVEPSRVASVAKSIATALYYAVPAIDPLGRATPPFTEGTAVPAAYWGHLAATTGYALIALAFGYVTTVVNVRRALKLRIEN